MATTAELIADLYRRIEMLKEDMDDMHRTIDASASFIPPEKAGCGQTES